MSRTRIPRSVVPAPPYRSALVCIPIEAVPFTLGALVLKSQKYWFASPDDWHRGRKLLAKLGASMLTDCTLPIVHAIDRVHNLLDASLNGAVRSVAGLGTETDPYVYDPPLSQAIGPNDYDAPSLRDDTRTTTLLLDNLINGSLSGAAPLEAIPNARLERIAVAVEALGQLDDDQLEQLIQIVTILGAV